MSIAYQAVQWNRQKRLYDAVIAVGCLLYLGVFLAVSSAATPAPTAEMLILRAFGSLALVLLHVVLSIGPLARLDRRFAPLLYNRRHLGVTMFLAALVHGAFALLQFHSFGTLHPLTSVLTGESPAGGFGAPLSQLPFQPFGLLALVILFLMASTSHDFWLANLTAPTWKALHMLVYVAYASVILHVALGILQVEQHPLFVALLAAGAAWVVGLHLLAGWRERAIDRRTRELEEQTADDGFVEVCTAADIPDRRALTVTLAGDRVAIFRDGDAIYALSSVCKHQNGPLGEGKIVDGCIVCPWHGYQYLPASGASPPPFHETVPTFRVRTLEQRVFVHPTPLPPGTETPTARVDEAPRAGSDGAAGDRTDDPYYIGWEPRAAAPSARRARQATALLLALALGLGAALAAAQGSFAPSFFDFGAARAYEGIVRLDPHPRLLVVRDAPGGLAADVSPVSSWLLVGELKHGAESDVAAFDGRRVRLQGTPVYRGRRTMLEVVAGSVEELADAAGPAAPELVSHGVFTLRGEIVDSKCHLGVMKPGEGKAHRACATLCIRGGIPPLFVVAGVRGDSLPAAAERLLLVGATGEAVGEQILPWVAEPVELHGEVLQIGDLWMFEADLSTLRRTEVVS